MEINYTEILIALITAIMSFLGVVVVKVLVPYLKFKVEESKSKLSKEQREAVDYWTKKAVIAIEKQFEGKERGQGPLKKEFVLQFVKTLNLNIAPYILDTLVDSIVEELINNPILEIME